MSTKPERNKDSQGVLSDPELAQLQVLVSTDLKSLLQADAEEEVNYAELLERLKSTDAMAQGVEQKLDSILEGLDALLESLGADPESQDLATAQSASEKSDVSIKENK